MAADTVKLVNDAKVSILPGAAVKSRAFGSQIKNRQRVGDLAEVYTHEREVNAMLDLVPTMFPGDSLAGVEFKFLEPACGSGNFLEEILRRKLRPIRFGKIRSVERYEHWMLRSMASIYGVDICAQNVAESRDRLLSLLRAHFSSDAKNIEPTAGFVDAARAILRTNVLLGNTLTEASTLEVVDYKAGRAGTFTRTWSVLDHSAAAVSQPDLFSSEPELKQDELPVHYSRLADNSGPTRDSFRVIDLSRGAS